ncbi:MAG: hypothetical protein R2778_05700 [Saprospiraceae bacterium]
MPQWLPVKRTFKEKVYADLLAARGDFRVQSPELTMNSGQQYVAWMDGETPPRN